MAQSRRENYITELLVLLREVISSSEGAELRGDVAALAIVLAAAGGGCTLV